MRIAEIDIFGISGFDATLLRRAPECNERFFPVTVAPSHSDDHQSVTARLAATKNNLRIGSLPRLFSR